MQLVPLLDSAEHARERARTVLSVGLFIHPSIHPSFRGSAFFGNRRRGPPIESAPALRDALLLAAVPQGLCGRPGPSVRPPIHRLSVRPIRSYVRHPPHARGRAGNGVDEGVCQAAGTPRPPFGTLSLRRSLPRIRSSVSPSVHPSVCLPVRPFVRPPIRRSVSRWPTIWRCSVCLSTRSSPTYACAPSARRWLASPRLSSPCPNIQRPEGPNCHRAAVAPPLSPLPEGHRAFARALCRPRWRVLQVQRALSILFREFANICSSLSTLRPFIHRFRCLLQRQTAAQARGGATHAHHRTRVPPPHSHFTCIFTHHHQHHYPAPRQVHYMLRHHTADEFPFLSAAPNVRLRIGSCTALLANHRRCSPPFLCSRIFEVRALTCAIPYMAGAIADGLLLDAVQAAVP